MDTRDDDTLPQYLSLAEELRLTAQALVRGEGPRPEVRPLVRQAMSRLVPRRAQPSADLSLQEERAALAPRSVQPL